MHGVAHFAPGALGMVVVLASGPARALDSPDGRDSARPCRPTVSCTADFTTPGTFEVEAGGVYSGRGDGTRQASFPILFKQTLARVVQLQVGSNGYTVLDAAPPARYFDNVFFGPKLHLHDQGEAWPSLSLSALASVPTFRRGGYTRNDDAFFTAFASKDLGPWHADFNAGLNVWRLGEAQLQEFAALALSTALSPLFSVAFEGYAFSDAASAAGRDAGGRIALAVAARSWLVADLGGDVGAFPSTRAYSFFLGATVIPAVLWRP
ncbi:MAG TPA: hypothetical protein VF395_18360 [Polyangiaceae bacterium]